MRTRLSHTISASAPYSMVGCVRVSVVMCPPSSGLSPAKHFAELVATVREHLGGDREEQQHDDAASNDRKERPIHLERRVGEASREQLEAKSGAEQQHDGETTNCSAKHCGK